MTGRDRPSSEFLSEAQDVIEELSRNLLELDAQQRAGQQHDPDLLNAAFRSMHTLKSLAALFNADAVEQLAHSLESTLDALRLGKISLGQHALDVLFEAVETFPRMLDEHHGPVDIDPLLERILGLVRGEDAPGSEVDVFAGIDPSILGVLTEYEEHRLRENIRMGRRLFRVHASFDLLAIDVGIEALKGKMKVFGEVITYLPSADASSDDRIDLDILLGSERPLTEISDGVSEDGVTVHELVSSPQRPSPAPAPTPPPAVTPTHAKAPAPTKAPPRTSAGGIEVQALEDTDPDPFPDDLTIPEKSRPSSAQPEFEDEAEAEAMSLRSLSQTVRVDLSRLDYLMNLIGELGVVQANFGGSLEQLRLREGSSDVLRDLQGHLRTMSRKLSLLQQGLLDVRMVPLGQVFDRLARVVRKLGRESGKEIRLGISGSQTELDKLIVEELSDPLMHMIRNAIDHGVESREERIEAGKSSAGKIDLRAFQRGNRVVIEVEDDGRGMDWRKIREKAIRNGVTTAEQAAELGASDVIDFIFLPGFSTRDTVTSTSGRGVGMDVVKTNISRLSGMIDVDTVLGRGTKFSITLPVTLAIIQALVIETCEQTFCIPLNSVLESIMVREADIVTVEGHEVISLRGRTLPLLHLSRMFDLSTDTTYADPERIYVVIVGLAQHRVGLVVDELVGQQDVVIKPLGAALRSVPGIAGATELGANRTVLLLDVSTLVDEALTRADLAVASGPAGSGPSLPGSGSAGSKKEARPYHGA
ncbi:chemotaxis protein CheA [Paraliomyxa miuraensis]|uniref:chemotaxis protein CheA n=1 Tax=Paraliomyxa miuraensis TaxID=376150 RepID=UPI002257BD38|nr:chemotaxis protein CheA [Paraliomyxa miuraensis]MCX4245791.1 chemotaxis protein CheA [Paraliomyxa miuraensis]